MPHATLTKYGANFQSASSDRAHCARRASAPLDPLRMAQSDRSESGGGGCGPYASIESRQWAMPGAYQGVTRMGSWHISHTA
jgi:hypothetical protein